MTPAPKHSTPRPVRAAVVIIGVLFILAALFAPSIRLVVGFDGFSVARVLLGILGVLLILIGAAGDQGAAAFGKVFTGIASLLLTVILVVMVLELLSLVLLNVMLARSTPDSGDSTGRSTLPYYQSVSWGATYWREHSEAIEYAPYVTWHHVPQMGETINVDEHGVRLTPGAQCRDGSYTVFVFGGSTVWGIGSPDDMTIPAYLQADLAAEHNQPVCVINFGDMAYVSTQEVIRLELELQAGHIPNAVIFYDGLNDIYSAYQSGTPGIEQNEAATAMRFDGTLPSPFLSLMTHSALLQVLGIFLRPPSIAFGHTYVTDHIDPDTLASGIVRVYIANRAIVAALAAQYGFELYWFWQPLITVTHKSLSPFEQTLVNALDPALVTLEHAAVAQVISDPTQHFYTLNTLYDDMQDTLWIDWAHVIPPGNERAAQTIVHIINGGTTP